MPGFDVRAIAGNDAEDQRRFSSAYVSLAGKFAKAYGAPPAGVARAPGRVDLMGSHTDYNGLPVLAMTIGRETRVAFRPCDDPLVRLRNVDGAFEPREFEIEREIPRAELGDWSNYARAAAQGLALDRFGAPSGRKWRGFDAMAAGDVPIGRGVSSSSAMVVAFALAQLAANGLWAPDKAALAQLLARAERYVGTEGGGMDQATSLLGQPGAALRIGFFPLSAKAVPLPEGAAWVLINSRTSAVKTAEARFLYNRRPVECRLAAAVLAKELGFRLEGEERLVRLSDLMEPGRYESLADAAAQASRVLGSEGWALKDVAKRLELSTGETAERFCRLQAGNLLPQPEDGFQLGRRARHIFAEARRVDALAGALEAGKADEIGNLLNASYVSCREDYQISRPELDALHAIALKSGAWGARIAGAGFGGCMIAALPPERLDSFRTALSPGYFGLYLASQASPAPLSGPPAEDELFVCRPIAGASAVQLGK